MLKVSILTLGLILIADSAALAIQDSVRLKIMAVNPSGTQPLNTTIEYQLPQKIEAEDVLDAAGMEVKYNEEKKRYFVTIDVSLSPKEARNFEVVVKNVWLVTDEDLAKVRADVEKSLESLSQTKFKDSAQLLYDKINEKLSQIEEEQGKEMGIKRRMGLYQSHQQQLAELRSEVLSLSALRRLQSEDEEGVRVAKFVIQAENPSSEPKEMTVRSELPKVVKANDILDRKGFELLFDKKLETYVLEKSDSFEGREKKKYEIDLRDIWYVPESEMRFVSEQTEKIIVHFGGSEYEEYANQISTFIYETLDQIAALQEEVGSSEDLQDRIRAFVLNQQRLEVAKKKFKELQDLLLEIPMKRNVTVIEEVRKSFKEIAKLLDVLTVGFQPNLSTTWWIILGIVVFLAIFSTSFYVIWINKLSKSSWGKQKAKKAAKPAPAEAAPPTEGEAPKAA